MQIESVVIKGYRNFGDAEVNLAKVSLVIGSNDVGKTNLIHAIRLTLDRSLSDRDLEPQESDFHIDVATGEQADAIEITVKISKIDKDAVISSLKGSISDEGGAVVRYTASRANLSCSFFQGANETLLEEIPHRTYLKFLSLRYIQSSRDLVGFIRAEKRHLLRMARESRSNEESEADDELHANIEAALDDINSDVGKLSYVSKSTDDVNAELKDLSHHHDDYSVKLDTGAIATNQFIDRLDLKGQTGDTSIGLGGDGRNNQILVALWKAKSEREHDLDNEGILYCVEEPEAHLHPHQQRKLAEYLTSKLKGQVLVTTHSPQITARFSPNSIIRLLNENGESRAASGGCSKLIEETWDSMGYRMTILPAEAFFAHCVLLVEGPSEVLFYHALAEQLDLDLDFYNISILSVDGVAFSVYTKILDAMEIPWGARTDNDQSRVAGDIEKWQLAGLNRALKLAGETELYTSHEDGWDDSELEKEWEETSELTNPRGVFVSKKDLERDLVGALEEECFEFTGKSTAKRAVAFFQKKKAVRMREFLAGNASALQSLNDDVLASPLHWCVNQVQST